jgi:hypothetical protein
MLLVVFPETSFIRKFNSVREVQLQLTDAGHLEMAFNTLNSLESWQFKILLGTIDLFLNSVR